MKPIIVIVIPLGICIDIEITEPYGYALFYGDDTIETPRQSIEELRETGGVIIVQPSYNSAIRKLLDPCIGEDGFIKDCGFHTVHKKEFGDFCFLLFHNPQKNMVDRAFCMMNNKKINSL